MRRFVGNVDVFGTKDSIVGLIRNDVGVVLTNACLVGTGDDTFGITSCLVLMWDDTVGTNACLVGMRMIPGVNSGIFHPSRVS